MKRIVVLALSLLAVAAQAQTPSPAVPATPPPVAETWLPKASADLAGLDKITARLTPMNVTVGQSASFRTLKITVRSCIVRGPDQPADQAAFLDITDANAPNSAFHGWMVLSDPAIGVMEHPVYDVKFLGCKP